MPIARQALTLAREFVPRASDQPERNEKLQHFWQLCDTLDNVQLDEDAMLQAAAEHALLGRLLESLGDFGRALGVRVDTDNVDACASAHKACTTAVHGIKRHVSNLALVLNSLRAAYAEQCRRCGVQPPCLRWEPADSTNGASKCTTCGHPRCAHAMPMDALEPAIDLLRDIYRADTASIVEMEQAGMHVSRRTRQLTERIAALLGSWGVDL